MTRGLRDRRGYPRVGGAGRLYQRLGRLERENAVLHAEVERLQRANQQLQGRVRRLAGQVEELRRAAKRQAAPFSKNTPAPRPRRPGRKPGPAYAEDAHQLRTGAAAQVMPACATSRSPSCGATVTATSPPRGAATPATPPASCHSSASQAHEPRQSSTLPKLLGPWPTASSGVRSCVSELIHHASCFGGLARSCRGSGPGAGWRSSHDATLPGPGDPVRPEEDAGFLPRRDGTHQPRCYGALGGLVRPG